MGVKRYRACGGSLMMSYGAEMSIIGICRVCQRKSKRGSEGFDRKPPLGVGKTWCWNKLGETVSEKMSTQDPISWKNNLWQTPIKTMRMCWNTGFSILLIQDQNDEEVILKNINLTNMNTQRGVDERTREEADHHASFDNTKEALEVLTVQHRSMIKHMAAIQKINEATKSFNHNGIP
ncbi:hypothetical protein HAX54_007088 [Datura stramonium]|uniref:Uncharacterized protein n=1 Tax=Datura stramonium TaxID=4076 RepID=A0ABS8TCG2_DATST|nr:hypothetical protein [Datura stramonium]